MVGRARSPNVLVYSKLAPLKSTPLLSTNLSGLNAWGSFPVPAIPSDRPNVHEHPRPLCYVEAHVLLVQLALAPEGLVGPPCVTFVGSSSVLPFPPASVSWFGCCCACYPLVVLRKVLLVSCCCFQSFFLFPSQTELHAFLFYSFLLLAYCLRTVADSIDLLSGSFISLVAAAASFRSTFQALDFNFRIICVCLVWIPFLPEFKLPSLFTMLYINEVMGMRSSLAERFPSLLSHCKRTSQTVRAVMKDSLQHSSICWCRA